MEMTTEKTGKQTPEERRARSAARSLAYYYAHKKERNDYKREYRKKHAQERNIKRRAEYATIPSEERSRRRRIKGLAEYGLNSAQYNKMFAEQNGRCAICGRQGSEFKRALSIDHNHKTKHVRGLLCPNCNTGLGLFGSDEHGTEILCAAIGYLKNNDKLLRLA